MNFKSELAPKGLQFNPADFVISDKIKNILLIQQNNKNNHNNKLNINR